MQKMFQSATLKLTAWYLAILMTISITFSIVIYQLNYREVNYRLETLQHNIISGFSSPLPFPIASTGPGSLLVTESRKASNQMILSLVYINGILFIAGGIGAYLLARRTLKPIAEAHDAQSRFTSDASHELRTPLSAMKTELEVSLHDPNITLADTKELLHSNLEEVNKLIQLSEMLLHLARLDHDKLEIERINLSSLLDDIIRRYPHEAERITVTARKQTRTTGNKPAITELMTILIDNALKYSPPNSPVRVRLFTHRGMVAFEVKNEGEKIPDDKLLKLFERFFRGDTSRTGGEKKGYGLGLSIAKKIVDIHHGNLTVSSSETETTFTFYLPITRNKSVKLQQSKHKI